MTIEEFIAALAELARDKKRLSETDRAELGRLIDALHATLQTLAEEALYRDISGGSHGEQKIGGCYGGL